MKNLAFAALAVAVLIAAGCGGSSSSSSSGTTNIVLWHGDTDIEAQAIKTMVAQYNASQSKVHVTAQYAGNSDYALQKVETAIASGNPPDISYLYGSWAANIAASPKVVDLNDMINADPSFGWNNFWPAERKAATVDGKIVGIPALVDNLALVYNKKMFKDAGVAPPNANWTWQDFTNAAEKMTDPSKKQFGWAYVNDASEDTVWRFDALLWEAGGQILTPDGKKAAFNSPAGIKAGTMLQNLVDKNAVYLDSGNQQYASLFNSGKIAMLYTGPWDLSQFPKVDYGVVQLPRDLNHQTIAGPDNWVMFNNGNDREKAAFAFLKWWTAPKQLLEWSTITGDLPTKDNVSSLPGYDNFTKKYPGDAQFVDNLKNALQSRPVIKDYPKISAAMGQAIQAILLKKQTPQQALDGAATQVNSILAASNVAP